MSYPEGRFFATGSGEVAPANMKTASVLGLAVMIGLSLASAACTTNEKGAPDTAETEPDPSDDDDDDNGHPTGDDDDKEEGTKAGTPKEECERYLACVNEAMPETGGTAVTLYGDDSACWKGSASDAKSCGDACRLARVGVARNDGEFPHCGCDEDSECKGFCSKAKGCTGSPWAGILEKCEAYAKDAKTAFAAFKKENSTQGGTFPCATIAYAKCDAIRALTFNSSYATDSKDRSVYPADLRKYYDAPRKSSDAWGILGYADAAPGAPSSCGQTVIFGLEIDNTHLQSVDLLLSVK